MSCGRNSTTGRLERKEDLSPPEREGWRMEISGKWMRELIPGIADRIVGLAVLSSL